jgi:thiol:disulfide interchange protein DsbD
VIRTLTMPFTAMLLLLASPVSPVAAADTLPAGPGRADLLSDRAAIAAGSPFTLALRMTLPEGWHTYWRNPGDAGAPVQVTWRLPAGFTASDLRWPAPERFVSGPIVSFGYQDEAWLLTTITPPAALAAGQTAAIAAAADWLICAKICVPQHADLSLSLPVAAKPQPAPPATQAGLARARAAVPVAPPWPVTATVDGTQQIVVRLDLPQRPAPRLEEAIFFPAGHDMIDIAAAQRLVRQDDETLLRLSPLPGQPPPARLEGVLVLSDGKHRQGYELSLGVTP